MFFGYGNIYRTLDIRAVVDLSIILYSVLYRKVSVNLKKNTASFVFINIIIIGP